MPRVDGRIPDAGDVFWIELGPPVGHEQAGRRPSLVLTPREYNERSSVLLTCPITRRVRSWPFQIEISAVGRVRGFALIDQIRVIDPAARACRFVGRVSDETLDQIRAGLISLLVLAPRPRPSGLVPPLAPA